jgi:hypothetical protein
MATQPQFGLIPETRRVQINTINADRTGGGTLVDLFTAGTTSGSSGSKVTKIIAKASGNSVSCLVLIFVTDTSGSNPILMGEIPIAAATATATVQSASGTWFDDDFQLKAGQVIKVCCTNLATGPIPINVFAQVADF